MEWISWEVTEDVALVTMDYKSENRLSGPFNAELRKAVAELRDDTSVKAVVFTGGHEKFFCNGLDLEWMMQQDKNTLFEFLSDVTLLLKDTALFPKPVVGAVNGHAFGLGTIWSSGFDFRIMREDRGWVCFPEMDINIPFLPGMIAICEHGLGKRLFRDMAWTARRMSGPDAVQAGWAREAVAKEKVVEKAMEHASFMAKKAQPAFGLTKQRWAKEVARIIDEEDPVALKSMPLPGE